MDIRQALNLLTESTGLECEFVETAPGQWYYLLQDYFQRDEFPDADWTDHAQCFGPFESYKIAAAHLRKNHANPGGHNVVKFTGQQPDAQMQKLMGEAPANMKYTNMPDQYDVEDMGDGWDENLNESVFMRFKSWGGDDGI